MRGIRGLRRTAGAFTAPPCLYVASHCLVRISKHPSLLSLALFFFQTPLEFGLASFEFQTLLPLGGQRRRRHRPTAQCARIYTPLLYTYVYETSELSSREAGAIHHCANGCLPPTQLGRASEQTRHPLRHRAHARLIHYMLSPSVCLSLFHAFIHTYTTQRLILDSELGSSPVAAFGVVSAGRSPGNEG